MLTFDVSTFFSELRPEMRDRILEHSSRKRILSGDWLFEQDEYADSMYLIKEGKLSLTMQFQEGLMDKLPAFGRGEIIGWSALVAPHIYTMGALAEEDSIVLAFDGAKMLEIMSADKETGYFILKTISELIGDRLVEVSTQLMSLKV